MLFATLEMRGNLGQVKFAKTSGTVTGAGADPEGSPEMTCGFLIQLVFWKKTMWFIGVEVEQEMSAPPPEKNPGSAPVATGKKTGQ